MTDCPLEIIDGRWECPLCGWRDGKERKDPPRRNCPADAKLRPKPCWGCATARRLTMELATRYLSGRWTRSAFDGGQLLAICRQCGKFAGDHCEKFTPAEFVATLCDATRRCKQWGPLTIPAC